MHESYGTRILGDVRALFCRQTVQLPTELRHVELHWVWGKALDLPITAVYSWSCLGCKREGSVANLFTNQQRRSFQAVRPLTI